MLFKIVDACSRGNVNLAMRCIVYYHAIHCEILSDR